MTDAAHHARHSRKLVGVVLAAVVALVVPAVAVAAPPEGKGPPAPSSPATATSIEFAITTPTITLPPGAPGAVGLVYVVQDRSFDVELRFTDGAGNELPLSLNQNTTVTVSHGETLIGTVDVPPETTNTYLLDQLSGTIYEPAADAILTATAATRPRPVIDESAPFDVLISSKDVRVSERTSTGGDNQNVDAPCNPTADFAVCADLLPPEIADFNANGLLSRGPCAGAGCSEYIQVLATFQKEFTDPATLIMKCDKELCGGGAIRKQKLEVVITPGSGPVTAAACPAKGVVAETGPPFCVDYVQSTRDNAGDTYLYLLFVEDAKVRFS